MKSLTLRAVATSLGTALSLLFYGGIAEAAPGDLDATFGTGGKVITPIGSSHDEGMAIARQSDGKLVVAGDAFVGGGSYFAVARYNTDGNLDTTFNGTGKVMTPITNYDHGTSVAVQSDGKIVLAGYSTNSAGENSDFSLLRYNSDGTLDTEFNGTGKVTTDLGGVFDEAYSVVIQGDGKIVAGGRAANITSSKFGIVRYNTNGTLDTSFSGTGKVILAFTGTSWEASVCNGLMLQGDGKIVAVGDGDGNIGVMRLNADGTLDSAFNGTGKVTTQLDNVSRAYAGIIQTDGKIVVAGEGNGYGIVLARYGSGGTLDTTFNGIGIVNTLVGGSGHSVAKGVAVQTDGKLVVAGIWQNDIVLARYNSNGGLDTVFNGTGIVTTSVGSGVDWGDGVVIQDDHKIVVAGVTYNGSNDDFVVVRYEPGEVGVPGPEITVEQPTSVDVSNGGNRDFGNVGQGGTSAPLTFTILNNGTADLTLGTPTLSGGDTGDFVLGTTSTASTVAPGGSTTFTATFAPTAIGTRSATVQISNNDGDENPFTFTLDGTGTEPSLFVVDFDSQAHTIPVYDYLARYGITITQETKANSLRSMDENLTYGKHVVDSTTGAMYMGTVGPTAGVPYSFRMNFAIPLNRLEFDNCGVLVPSINASWTASAYDAVGSLVAQVQFLSPPATFASSTFVLQPIAGQKIVSVVFSNTSSSRAAFVSGNWDTFKLYLSYPPAPEIAVEQPETVGVEDSGLRDLGTVRIGSSRAPMKFTIRNRGLADLTIGGVTVNGGNDGDFILDTTGMATTLPPKTTTTFTVTFSPSDTGQRTTTLQIASNDADEDPYHIDLQGSGSIAGASVTDNFDDNNLDPAKWHLEDTMEHGFLTEDSKRLNYTATVENDPDFGPFGEGFSYVELLAAQPSYAEDWQVTVDVTNSALAASKCERDAGLSLAVYNADGTEDRVTLSLQAADGIDTGDFVRNILSTLDTDGVEDPDVEYTAPATGTIATLRISFNAATKVFTLAVDRSGPANGYQWVTLGTYGIMGAGGTHNSDWEMDDAGTFQIYLAGWSWNAAVPAGQMYFDNFNLSSGGIVPVAITEHPVSQTIVAGQGTTLSVMATGSPIGYQWYEGMSGDTALPVAGATNATFTTPPLNADAQYWVRVSNSLSAQDSHTATITISAAALAPTFAAQPQSQLVFQDAAVTFNPTVTGSAPLNLQWRKGAANVAGATTSLLTLAPVKTSHAGVYALRAQNTVGTQDSESAYLGVITRGPAGVSVNVNTTLTLNASVTVPTGTAATYHWQKDEVNVINGGRRSGADTKTLKITGMQPEDAGIYTCLITMITPTANIPGSTGQTVVTVVEKPVFDEGKVAADFTDVRVGQIIDFAIQADNNPTKYTIGGLPPGVKLEAATGRLYGSPTAAKVVKGAITPYTLKISASNSAGSSEVFTVPWTVQPLYPGTVGTFYGLVAIDPMNQDLGGSVKITVASTGGFTGTLSLAGKSYPLTSRVSFGNLDDPPEVLLTIARKAPLPALNLQAGIDTDTGELSGTLADPDSAAAVQAWRNPWTTVNPAAGFVATFNTAFDPAGGDGPEGYGFMPVKVTNTGAVTWTGKLADGTAITGGAGLGPDGQIAMHHPLYGNTGSFQGWLNLTAATKYLDGTANWTKAPVAEKSTSRSYRDGFLNPSVTIVGAAYVKPAGAVLDLPQNPLPNAQLTLAGGNGNVPGDAQLLFSISAKNAVTPAVPNPYAMKLTLTPATGLFSGSFTLSDDDPTDLVDPIAKVKRSPAYSGILVTRDDFKKGAGYFIIGDLPYLDPDTGRRVSNTLQWSGGALLESAP